MIFLVLLSIFVYFSHWDPQNMATGLYTVTTDQLLLHKKCHFSMQNKQEMDLADQDTVWVPWEEHESHTDRAEGIHPDVSLACGDQPLTGDIQWLNELAHIESAAPIFSQAGLCVGVWIRAGFHRL